MKIVKEYKFAWGGSIGVTDTKHYIPMYEGRELGLYSQYDDAKSKAIDIGVKEWKDQSTWYDKDSKLESSLLKACEGAAQCEDVGWHIYQDVLTCQSACDVYDVLRDRIHILEIKNIQSLWEDQERHSKLNPHLS